MGRPSKELYTALGALILQQIFDLSDEETMQAVVFNAMWHIATDTNELLPALKSAQARDCGPETVLGDSLYGSDDNVLAAAELGVEVIVPAMGTEEKGTKLHFSDFYLQGF